MSSLPNLEQVKSVASQINNSFSAPVKSLGGAVSGFLNSKPTSIGEALGNVGTFANKLGGTGMSAVSSVTSALNQLSNLGTYTKFNDTFSPPSKIGDKTPEQAKNKPLGNFTYPRDIGDYYISFNFKEYLRDRPLTTKKNLNTVTINLPIPTGLQEQFGMQYADKALGVAGFVENIASDIIKGGGSQEAFRQAGQRLGETVKTPGQGMYYAGRTLAGLSDSIGAAVDKATGSILNPFQALIFQGINLRTHQFTYRFSPNSPEESAVLKKIISEFKIRMHPQLDNLLYNFPDICDISFGTSGDPYFFKTCFLESMTVNYAPSGQPSFFAGTKQPTEIELSLTFKETTPVTREDIEIRTALDVSPDQSAGNTRGGTRGGR